MPCMAQLPRVLVGMEACGGAHYWARQLREQGHEVRLIAPQYVTLNFSQFVEDQNGPST